MPFEQQSVNVINRRGAGRLAGFEAFDGRFSGPIDHETVMPGYFLWGLVAGLNDVLYQGRRAVVGPELIQTVNPFEPIETVRRLTPATHDVVLLVDRRAFAQAASELADRTVRAPAFHGLVAEDPLLRRLLLTLHAELATGEDDLALATLGAHLLHRLLTRQCGVPDRTESRRRERPAIERVRHLLIERYADALTLDDLAAEARLTRFHLLRAFRAEVGLTPHAYQTEVRLRRARDLLAGGLPITAVANELGFTDQSHLHRHFKRRYGLSPGAYARLAGVVPS